MALTGYSTPLFWNGPDAYESPTSRALALLASRAKSFLDVGLEHGDLFRLCGSEVSEK